MTQRTSISSDSYLVERRIAYEGAKPTFAITVPGVTTITDDATLKMYIYKGSTESSSTFLTGSLSVSGNIITTKTFQALKGGDALFVTVFATMDGVYDCVCAFWLSVKKLTGK
jgi:hypothetical protein